MKKILIVFMALVLGLSSASSYAGEMDVDFFGLSYHFDKSGADHAASNKLDNAGVWVLNPGIGLGYDFRQTIRTDGLSPIVHAGTFYNCGNTPFYFAGGGARYRKFFYKKFFWEADVMGVATYGNDWDQPHYKFDVTPYANVGIGYDMGRYITTFSVSYIPKDSGNSVTQGTDLLFFNISIGF